MGSLRFATTGFGPAAVTYLADCSETLAADRSALMSFYTVTLAGGSALGAVLGGVMSRWLYIDGIIVLEGGNSRPREPAAFSTPVLTPPRGLRSPDPAPAIPSPKPELAITPCLP